MGTQTKKKNGRLFIKLAIYITISLFIVNTISSLISVENVKKKVEALRTEHYVDVAEGYSRTLTVTLDEYFGALEYYLKADVVETKDSAKIVKWLRDHEGKRNPYFDYVAWVDADGDFYSDVGAKTNVKDRDYYQAIMQKGLDMFIDNPVTSKTTGKTIVHLCKAAKVDGKTVGFFCAVITTNHMAQLLDGINMGDNGIAVMFSGDGQLIAKIGAPDMVTLDFVADGGNQNNEMMKNKISSETQSKNGTGVSWGRIDGFGKVLNIYAPIEYTQWALVIILKDSVITKKAAEIGNVMALINSILILIVIIIVSAFVYIAFKPLRTVETAVKEIATGNADLTKRIDLNVNNEIGRVVDGFNDFTEKLQEIVTAIKFTKDELVAAGESLNQSTQDTSSAITEIIANIDSMGSNINLQSESVTETAGAVNQIASNIESLNKMIEGQASAVTQASASVEEMIGNINSVSSSVMKMANQFKTLQEQSVEGLRKQEDVSAKIEVIESESQALQEANSVIKSIAEQTNLLAMNAAIEAAHAGEAGKGFSVVADEIRKLSENSSSQSNSIGVQLKKISDSINAIVSASESAKNAFSSVSSGIELTNNLVQEITNSMQEQSEGSRQISEALNEMNNSTAEVKTASLEMSEGNKQILTEIRKLQDATYNMKTGMDEMSVGATQINRTGADLSSISEHMENSIAKIGEQVDQFKV